MPLAEVDHEAKWISLWTSIGAQGDPKVPYLDLRKRYVEPQRRYHTWKHIADGLGEFEAVASFAQNPNAVRWAYYFHDAIYDTQVSDSQNVDQSAELAVGVMSKAQLSKPLIKAVSDLVIATKHTTPPITTDAKLIVDIDFSILGKSSAEFDEYERDIRQEYSWVEEQIFRSTRAGILERFLQRPQIFNTPYFVNKYEAQARINLQRSITQLRGSRTDL